MIEGLRSFLVRIANLILFLMVAIAPIIVVLAVAYAYGERRYSGVYGSYVLDAWNWSAGFMAGLLTFLVSLPTAAMVAVFLDIREQLAAMNRGQDELLRIERKRVG